MKFRAASERARFFSARLVREMCVVFALVGGMWGLVFAQEPPGPVPLPAAVAAPPAVDWDVPLPLEVTGPQVFPARIHTWLNAYAAWVTDVCQLDNDQRGRVEQLVVEQAASAQVKEAARSIWPKHQGPFSFSRPTITTKCMYPGWFANERSSVAVQLRKALDVQLVREVLTPAQAVLLTDALDERTPLRRTAFRDLLIQRLHYDLSLSARQWVNLRQAWDSDADAFDSPLFNLGHDEPLLTSTRGLRQRPPVVSAGAAARVLSRDQQLYWERVTADPTPPDWSLMLGPQLNEDTAAQLEVLRIEYKNNLRRFAEIRIQSWIADEGLSAEATAALRDAAAGAAEIASRIWAQGRILAIRLPGNPESQPAPTVNLSSVEFGPITGTSRILDREPLWSAAVERTFGRHPWHSPAETARARDVLVNATLVLLDQELWLSPDQRHRLRPLIDVALPADIWNDRLWGGPDREVIWCAYPLLKIPVEQRRDLLTPPQQQAWSAMAAMFIRQREIMQVYERNAGAPEGFSDHPQFADEWSIRNDGDSYGEWSSAFRLEE